LNLPCKIAVKTLKTLIYFQTKAAMSRSSYLRGKFHEKLVKLNENSLRVSHRILNLKSVKSLKLAKQKSPSRW
jgi:hypothetical protein